MSERELPECARLTSNNDEEIMETIEDKDIQKAILASRQTNPSGSTFISIMKLKYNLQYFCQLANLFQSCLYNSINVYVIMVDLQWVCFEVVNNLSFK